ncbi:hypothetical protein [Actinomyces ruminicola]|uniref:SagB/ThcOx family dehydrogenase n=1 Tax=Actinomyces ruminicola TaxID=332524 RepID=A0A1G9YZ62_9ACTO|nr:hypothetical protein [Actinomyces ruminicola]SDN14350.1 hypothetical protein SAMN04487766_11513 [Actinomyces ruminicola]
MRTEFTLMQKTIAGFSTGTPTADGRGRERILRGFPRERPVPLPESVGPGLSLRETLDRRSSSLTYSTDGLFLAERLASLRGALRRDREDWGDVAEEVPLEGFVLALRCIDLAPGVYRVDADGAAYIAQPPPPEHWEDFGVQKEFARAGAIVSVAADLDRADSWGGAHGYRVAMARASAAVYDFHLDCTGHGLVGTVFAGFIPASVRHLLKSDGASRHQMFAVTVAPPPDGA